MPLQNNASTFYGSNTWRHGDYLSEGTAVAGSQTFSVNPNPCYNGEKKARPGVYSYNYHIRRNPVGYARGYYYWGNPSDRKRVPVESEGVFSGPWSQFDNNSLQAEPVTYALDKLAARNRAINKLLDKLRNSDVNLGVTIGEGRETLRMVAAIARSARSPMKALASAVHKSRVVWRREGRVASNARTTLTTVGSLELSWNVGLAPLLDDCERLRKHVQSAKQLDFRYSIDSRASSSASWSRSHSDGSVWSMEVSDRFQFGMVYKIGDQQAFETWRLGLTARPTLVWELTTLSWVVDYFLQIGNFLAALEASYCSNGVTFINGYETSARLATGVYERSYVDPSNADRGKYTSTTDWHDGSVHGRGSKKWVSKVRNRISGIPTQALPTIKLPTSSTQLLNCAALLSNLLTR